MNKKKITLKSVFKELKFDLKSNLLNLICIEQNPVFQEIYENFYKTLS